MSGLIVKAAFLADDVRREENGKQLIVGAYHSRFTSDSFPSDGSYYLVVVADIVEAFSQVVRVRFKTSDDEILSAVKGTLNAKEAQGGVLLPVGPFSMSIAKPDTITAEISFDGGPWSPVADWTISQEIAP